MMKRKTLLAFSCLLYGSLYLPVMAQQTAVSISNPSFETNGFENWTQTSMQTQTNTSFPLKDGTTYVEKWVNRGSRVGDCSVMQTIKSLANGQYMLKVAAHNIQQDSPTASQSGAWIFANEKQLNVDVQKEYELTFTHIDGALEFGFKAVGATGNYIAVDNFRLYLINDSHDIIKAELQSRIAEAEQLTGLKMQTEVLNNLKAAIESAKAEAEKETNEGYAAVAIALKQAVESVQASAEAFAALDTAIAEATESLGDGTKAGSDALKKAIEEAKAIAENLDSDINGLENATTNIENAMLAFNIANATGNAPTVVTYPFIARGSTEALGRSTISGSGSTSLLERGFCWSTHPEPTVLDNRTTKYFSQNGLIYHIEGLTPSTVYYMRAYAITKDYAVGYGDVLKVITIPRGKVTWSYNNGGPAADNARINAAVADAVSYLNRFTSISGFHTNVNYGSGTPTADCSYGGWMRVGPNTSYQRTGTILHELGHGVGVGTHEIWYGGSSPMRSGSGRGDWLGDRTTQVIRFLENSKTAVLTGDGTHMWPYGVNGAHEDTGSPMLYISNTLIYQALGEDGLPPTGGFATPAYTFDNQEEVKYYIKNESEQRGLLTSYLTVNKSGYLIWKEMTADNAVANDSTAWYITFNPKNCYYQLRNAATGKYISYSGNGNNGIKTVTKTTLTANENFQLMRSRADVTIGQSTDKVTARGYWIIHPESKLNPGCLGANVNGTTATTAFNLANSASTQRWLILTADEMGTFDTAIKGALGNQLTEVIEQIKLLAETPHTEDVSGTDAALQSKLSELEAKAETDITTGEMVNLIAEAKQASMDFLANATPSDMNNPFDLTYLIENASIEGTEGWTGGGTANHSCVEFYQTTFDFYQTLTNLPVGTYQLKAQGFQRPGTSASVYASYTAGTNNVNAQIYINGTYEKIQNVATEARTTSLGGDETTVGSSPTMYMPNGMESSSKYFAKGYYDNAVTAELTKEGANLKIGIRCTSSSTYYWTIFDNFRLYYYGSITAENVNSVESPALPVPSTNGPLFATPQDIYSLQGVLVRKAATGLDGLEKGIYIIGRKKIAVK